jgi:hypothetical protein
VNTIFLTLGPYTYADSLNLGNTGKIVVHN